MSIEWCRSSVTRFAGEALFASDRSTGFAQSALPDNRAAGNAHCAEHRVRTVNGTDGTYGTDGTVSTASPALSHESHESHESHAMAHGTGFAQSALPVDNIKETNAIEKQLN